MFNRKVCTFLWIAYIAIYLWGRIVPHHWENSFRFYGYLIVDVVILTGVVGYVAGVRLAYRIIWRILFLAFLFAFSLSLVMVATFERSGLLMLATMLPALYALYAYAYRSQHIWASGSATHSSS